jgi:hypothetical protein
MFLLVDDKGFQGACHVFPKYSGVIMIATAGLAQAEGWWIACGPNL